MRDQIENSVVIRRSITEVFPYVVTPAHWPEWAGPVIAVDTATQPGPLLPDDEFTVVSKAPGQADRRHVPGDQAGGQPVLQYETTTGPLPHQFTLSFESVPDGTRVTQTVVADQDAGQWVLQARLPAGRAISPASGCRPRHPERPSRDPELRVVSCCHGIWTLPARLQPARSNTTGYCQLCTYRSRAWPSVWARG